MPLAIQAIAIALLIAVIVLTREFAILLVANAGIAPALIIIAGCYWVATLIERRDQNRDPRRF